jgi:hypothetical protein
MPIPFCLSRIVLFTYLAPSPSLFLFFLSCPVVAPTKSRCRACAKNCRHLLSARCRGYRRQSPTRVPCRKRETSAQNSSRRLSLPLSFFPSFPSLPHASPSLPKSTVLVNLSPPTRAVKSISSLKEIIFLVFTRLSVCKLFIFLLLPRSLDLLRSPHRLHSSSLSCNNLLTCDDTTTHERTPRLSLDARPSPGTRRSSPSCADEFSVAFSSHGCSAAVCLQDP